MLRPPYRLNAEHNKKERFMFCNDELITEMDRLKKFAYKLTQNMHDAEDLLHNTIVRAIDKKHLFKKDSNLFSWTSKIMYNLFVSSYRRKTKFETQYDPENYLERESVDASQETKAELNTVGRAMETLKKEHKQILMMICVNGRKYAEVSNMLNIPVGTVRSRLSRAREKLQVALTPSISHANTNNAPMQAMAA